MTLLCESQYFPPVILFKKVIEFSNVEFDLYDVHRKMSFRNRCVVAGGGGPVNLSIPLVEGRNQRKPLKEVEIDNRRRWQEQHWRTITSCYNRSPWFEFYKSELEVLYTQRVEMLADWNRLCWDWVIKKLGVPVHTTYAENYRETVDPGQYLDWRSRLMPRSLETDFPHPVKYRQVFEERTGFIPHLSILDLLFCEGKASVEILDADKIPN